MNGFQNIMQSSALYLEICPSSLKALNGEEGMELLLERLPNGRLTDACKEKLTRSLTNFLKRKSWQPRARAVCAISARGVSLRRLVLPAAGKEELQRVLRMQIETEFPLPPDELAWGYRSLGENRQNGVVKQELLVMAVKKDVVDEYAELLARCGLVPVFTLAALARSAVCPQPLGTCALLDVGLSHSELIQFEDGVPGSVRVFPWGDQTLNATNEPLDALVKSLPGFERGKKLFLSGRIGGLKDRLVQRLNGIECEPLKVAAGEGQSAAVLGLKKFAADDRGLLLFQSSMANNTAGLARPAPLKWALLAAALLLSLLLLPYAEALVLKPWLTKKLATLRADAGRLPQIESELNFLQSLKANQQPYLDALYLFAKYAPAGSRLLDNITMNRRGEISLRGSLRSYDQVAEFRSKLINSGFFLSVSVDEQTPTPDRQKVNVRMSALWKPYGERMTQNFGPTAQEIERARTNKEAQVGGMAPGGMPPGMPAGMPSGIVLPPGVTLPPGMSLPPGVSLPAGMEMPPGAAPVRVQRKEP